MSAVVAQPPSIPMNRLDNRPVELGSHHVKLPATAAQDQMMQDLLTDGFAVVRNVITPEKAAGYVDEAHKWLEGFNLGYKRDDPNTWHKANLPECGKGGLYSLFSIAHAQWVWDIKTEPKYVELFERIWGTDKLAVSFDGGYLGVPLPVDEVEGGNKPWPHTDQSPHRDEFYCIQSLMNLLPNGPKDGGLSVLKGSSALFGDWVKAFDATENCPPGDHFRYTDEHMAWFKEHGCEWVKPSLGPGDVIFWDSRTAHTAAAPSAGKHRFAVYTCYKPAEGMTEAQLKKKQFAFENGYVTSHDPITFSFKRESDAERNILFPYGKPKLSEKALKAAGMIPY